MQPPEERVFKDLRAFRAVSVLSSRFTRDLKFQGTEGSWRCYTLMQKYSCLHIVHCFLVRTCIIIIVTVTERIFLFHVDFHSTFFPTIRRWLKLQHSDKGWAKCYFLLYLIMKHFVIVTNIFFVYLKWKYQINNDGEQQRRHQFIYNMLIITDNAGKMLQH